jgi:signal transduction histidine kinase/DNA-binding response OmpR family regulator
LRVNCTPLEEAVYVDREMWEKIVLNLVSNAFKYTLEGEIEVSLRRAGGNVVLSVRDTGSGIPADQLALLFERFHRVAGARGRTQEGTGIGLALVKELVHLHGGDVRAESEFGKGSTFTVTVPLGKSHLPAERIGAASTLASTAIGAAPYIEEALRWLPAGTNGSPGTGTNIYPDSFRPEPPVGSRPRILLADDNADMRDYITRLLANLYEVEATRDGGTALAMAQSHVPDLILTDIMMPGLDGFGLLKALRADPRTASVPVLPLSARAGEEARVEGLQAGADDYLTKPFSARELLARIQAHLALARMRREASEALRQQSERLRLLWESATVLLTTDDPDALLRSLFTKIAPHFGLDTYLNFLVNEAGDSLYLGSCGGIPEEEVGKIACLDFGQAVCGTVALRRQPIVATHIQQSDEPMVQLVKRLGMRAYACNPLLVEGQLLGTLSFASRSRDQFEPDDLEFLRTISQYVTVAYERLRLVRQLRDQDRRKDEFLAMLAHELRNPLAPLRNSLQILGVPSLDAAALEQSREMMERQVQQLVRLVDDLLDVSRVMRGKLVLHKEPVALATIVARAVETAQPFIDAQHHELTIALPSEPFLLEADPVRLAQVVGNLLANAAKYTEPAGRIWLSAEHEGDAAVIRVRDTGIGMAPDLLPRIFDLFVQADHTATRSQGGLGIGLTLVKNLVAMHGGTVEAHSAGLGRGSEFVVRLPLAARQRDQTAPGKNGQAAQTTPPPGRRLLIVDDNRDAADSLALLLRLQGHDVQVVYDGQAALELVKAQRPELVFLDLGMTKMDGYEVARRIRQDPGLKTVRLAALTGWGQQDERRRTTQAGFDHHFVKPVDPAALQCLLADQSRSAGDGNRCND